MDAQRRMGSFVRTISSPFRKARTVLNTHNKGKKAQQDFLENDYGVSLHGEVMACTYEDVRVMWSILDKSSSSVCDAAGS